MIINTNPDKTEIDTKTKICQFHKKNPGVNYAGCMCYSIYNLKYQH